VMDQEFSKRRLSQPTIFKVFLYKIWDTMSMGNRLNGYGVKRNIVLNLISHEPVRPNYYYRRVRGMLWDCLQFQKL